jgi:putative membrane protein
MDIRYAIATIHILTFGLGFYSCWARANALRNLKDENGVKDVLSADNLWGIAAALWLFTGLWRAFGGLEKGSDYYLHNTAFIIKISLFALVFILEVKPMITFIRWRVLLRKKQPIDLSIAPTLARISYLELFLLIPIVAMATAMARGILY